MRPRRTPSHDLLLAVVSFHSWFPKATLLVLQYAKIHTHQLVDVQSLFLVLCSARIPPEGPPPENLIQRPNHWWQLVGPISTLPHLESLASYWRQAGKAISCVAERLGMVSLRALRGGGECLDLAVRPPGSISSPDASMEGQSGNGKSCVAQC